MLYVLYGKDTDGRVQKSRWFGKHSAERTIEMVVEEMHTRTSNGQRDARCWETPTSGPREAHMDEEKMGTFRG